jgi:hypothetical protein
MIEWLTRFAQLIDAELGTRTAIAAIVYSLAISWCWTQWSKGLPVWWTLSDGQMRWATRLGAFLSGSIPAFILWPVHDLAAAVIATAIGMASPTIYLIVKRVLTLKYPKLEGVLSARPDFEQCRRAPPKPPNAGKSTM